MDHRDIFAGLGEDGGTDAMIAFMSRGNIRVSPELPGINLQVEPTAVQYEKIADLVERLGWKEKSFSVDFDNQSGETVDTLNYEGNVSARKVVSDIRYYFKEGEVPQTSDLAKFRYALPETDSEGNKLSEGQRKYFDGTKVVDQNGNLLRVYHGSPSVFTEFSHRFMGSHGSMEGQGFYFTQNKDMAEGYSKTGGQLLDGYLSIKKPLSDSEVTLSPAEIKRLIQAIDPTGDDVIVNYDSAGGMGYPSKAWYNRALKDTVDSCMNYCDSDSEILANIANSGAGSETVLRTAKQVLGYDGYIVDGKYDNSTIYVAFTSEQFKNADNTAPTASPDIRYALPTVPPVEPTSQEWHPTIDTAEAKKRFPALWDVTADESESRNPTQIRSTVSTYRKIYDILKSEGFNGTVLDASSGLGYGTRAGIEEYGFKVDDIEPYPDRSYSPKYTDYSALHGKYDVIISNAVLNVLPQDQRDALVVKMGELLADGGRLFVNVRGDDVNTLSGNPDNVRIGNMEWFVSSTGSYQKGFTRNELVAYLKDALGTDFSVQGTTKFGKAAAVVTKDGNIRYALTDVQAKNEQNAGEGQKTVANYTEEQYNRFGWARAENALSKAELDDLYAKVQARSTLRTFKQSKNGEAIIEVNRKPHTTLDIDNVFVFVKGKKDDFRITRVVRFDVQTETEMDNIRRVLYEGRTCNDTYIRFNEEKGLAREYRREDLQSFAEYSKERTERGASNGETSRGTDTDNRRSEKYRSGYSLHVGEDGKITERYALADDRKEGNLSRGQRAKFIANNTRMRQYSRTDAAETIDSIVDAIGFGDQVFWMKAGLSGKSRSEVISYLFEKLNTTKEGYRAGVALNIADYIIQNATLTEVYNEAGPDNETLQAAVDTVEAIGKYRHRFDLESIKSEIRYQYDDKAGNIFRIWSQKNGGLTTDTVAQDLLENAS